MGVKDHVLGTFLAKWKMTKQKLSVLCVVVLFLAVEQGEVLSGMTNHLKRKHKEQLTEIMSSPLSGSEKNSDIVPSSSSVRSHSQCTQPTIEEAFITIWDITDFRAKEIHYAIAEMIATDNQPISIVENQRFNRLLHLLKPKYKLPGRKYMSEVVIPTIYERVKKLIKDEISKGQGCFDYI